MQPTPEKGALEEALAGLGCAGQSSGEPGVGAGGMTRATSRSLRELAKRAIVVHVRPGEELLSCDSLEEGLLVVAKGSISVQADVHLTEKLEYLTPGKVRIRLFIDRAERLVGDSLVDTLDPYCIVKLGASKNFQTHAIENAGTDPRWEYTSAFIYDGEESMEFTVMDRNALSTDSFCGSATVAVSHFPDRGWTGKVELMRPKRRQLFEPVMGEEESAGSLYFTALWDFEKISPHTKMKEYVFPNTELFVLQQLEIWGHEPVMLGSLFRKLLVRASDDLRYALELGQFRVVAVEVAGDGTNQVTTCWKISRHHLLELLQATRREKKFVQECQIAALQKQAVVKKLITQLIEKFEREEATKQAWAVPLSPPQGARNRLTSIDQPLDAESFRAAYCGSLAGIVVRSAAHLPPGGWFRRLQPYAVLRFRGSTAELRTSVLADVGGDPVWNCEGSLLYGGEKALEISVLDYNDRKNDELVAVGTLFVEEFFRGFEGSVVLRPGRAMSKRKVGKSMSIVIGVQWEPLLNRRGLFAPSPGQNAFSDLPSAAQVSWDLP
uniref:C2 domain-containing protein n=1 Tax=Pyrodinium bahamense TaxID=73915 RepID=A0A7S0FFI7_9DINO